MEIDFDHEYDLYCDCGWDMTPDGCINCRANNDQKIIIKTTGVDYLGNSVDLHAHIEWVH